MLKKALASAGIAAVALGASAGFASAAPADKGEELPDIVDICNAPNKQDPDHQDAYTGILKKGDPINAIVSGLLPNKNIILGLCDNAELPKGDDSEGGDEQTPGDTDGPGNSDGQPGGGNENQPPQGGGDSPFPVPSLA